MIGERIETNIAGGLDVPMPRMANIRQKFQTVRLESVTRAIAEQFKRPEVRAKVKPGQTIAVGCGSRGVANVGEAAKAVVAELKALGAKPFIFPAMGSHGGATVEGQVGVLAGYGITEALAGCPIRATMDTVELGTVAAGTPVYMDKFAAEADGVVLINRVKPHTNFRAPMESGIVKMMTIGMGKIKGATTLHFHGMDNFGEILPQVAKLVMAKKNILFGVGMVENAHDETALIEIMPAEQLFARETVLQAQAKAMMARIYFDDIDVLVIDEMGKNISGAGFDPNITGRNNRFVKEWQPTPRVQKIVALALTEETHGNATGLGLADVITMRLFKEMDVGPTYANVIASAYLDGAAIPIIMNTEHDAIALAVKSLVRVKPSDARIVRIRNTLELTHIQVSEPLLELARRNPQQFEILGGPAPFKFDGEGKLALGYAA
jgi:hypothetical protein